MEYIFLSVALFILFFVFDFAGLFSILDVIIPQVLVTFLLTGLGRIRLAPQRISFKHRILIGLGAGVLVAALIFFSGARARPEGVTDLGEPCIHSVMCQGRCWADLVSLQSKNRVKRYGAFVVGVCGRRWEFGCSTEVSWGLEKPVACIDPTI